MHVFHLYFSGADNSTGDFKGSVPGGALIYCKPGLQDTIADLLICAGADVNVDVFPKERPGYKLLHIAACHFANGLTVSAQGKKGIQGGPGPWQDQILGS
jgi:hypothetical protein